jgi:hypothetical protein
LAGLGHCREFSKGGWVCSSGCRALLGRTAEGLSPRDLSGTIR